MTIGWEQAPNCSLWIINSYLTFALSWGAQKARCPSFNLELSKQISLAHILIEAQNYFAPIRSPVSWGLLVDDEICWMFVSLQHRPKLVIRLQTKVWRWLWHMTVGMRINHWQWREWRVECKFWLVMRCSLSEFLSRSFLSRLLATPCDTEWVRGPGEERGKIGLGLIGEW